MQQAMQLDWLWNRFNLLTTGMENENNERGEYDMKGEGKTWQARGPRAEPGGLGELWTDTCQTRCLGRGSSPCRKCLPIPIPAFHPTRHPPGLPDPGQSLCKLGILKSINNSNSGYMYMHR